MPAIEQLFEFRFPEGMDESEDLKKNPPTDFISLLPVLNSTALQSVAADVLIQKSAGPAMCFAFLQCHCREEMKIEAQNKEDGVLFLLDIRGGVSWSVTGHSAAVSCNRGQQCAFSAPAGVHKLSLKPGLHQHVIVCMSAHLSGLMAGEWPMLSPLYAYAGDRTIAPLALPACIFSQANSSLIGKLAACLKANWSLWKTVEETVYSLLGNYARQLSGLEQRREGSRASLRRRAQQYMHAHYLDPGLNKAAVAEALHVSVSTLEKAFKGSAVNIHDFILVLRLLKAREWLYLTDRPVREIAMDVGFFDASNFNKAFKKRFFITASQFRLDGLELRNGKNA